MELKGSVAIVTGAGRGIGRATALELARMGADIVVAELDQARRQAHRRRGRARSAAARWSRRPTSRSARTCAPWWTAPRASSGASTSS